MGAVHAPAGRVRESGSPRGLPIPPRSLRLPGLSSPHLVSPGRSGYCAAPERAETLTSRPGPRGLLSPGEPAVLGQAPRIRSCSSRHRLAKPNRSPSCRLVSLRRPPHGAHRGGSTQGVKTSGSPWLLGCVEETLIRVLAGKETHAHSGLGRRRATGETAREPPTSSRFPRLPGTRQRRPARFSLRSSARRGREAGEEGGEERGGREASPGCAPRGPEPQISHRSAGRSRVRPGTGRAGGGPAPPGSRGLGAAARVPLPPPSRAPGATGWTLGGSRCGDPLVSSRAGQKLCKRSLANRKFLIDKVLPLPHARLQNKTKTRRERPTHPARARRGLRPLSRLGDPCG